MITLIGTSHFDLEGYYRLINFLNYLKPSLIALETTKIDYKDSKIVNELFSNESILNEAVSNLKDKFPNLNQNTVRHWLFSQNYDTKAISEYVSLNKVPLIFCDKEEELKKITIKNSTIENPFLSKEILSFLSLNLTDAKRNVEQEYACDEYPVKDSVELTSFYKSRDEFAEKILRKHSEETQKLVYICGLDHIYGDYTPNLFERLKDLNPRRLKLNYIDDLTNY